MKKECTVYVPPPTRRRAHWPQVREVVAALLGVVVEEVDDGRLGLQPFQLGRLASRSCDELGDGGDALMSRLTTFGPS